MCVGDYGLQPSPTLYFSSSHAGIAHMGFSPLLLDGFTRDNSPTEDGFSLGVFALGTGLCVCRFLCYGFRSWFRTVLARLMSERDAKPSGELLGTGGQQHNRGGDGVSAGFMVCLLYNSEGWVA